uniref:Aquaporin 14 n=1 Tax=Sphenodon punctatus TaxID=8508 RepID=A0A8D0GHX2_SPHPU
MAIQEEPHQHFWRPLLAEAMGTLIFVWVVLGASTPGGPPERTPPPVLQPALAAGLAAVGLAHCFREISGAQANPALTMAFLCTRKLGALRAGGYILAQCLGAILASGIFYLVLPAVVFSYNAGQALGMEVLSTFQLTFTIFAVEDQRRREVGELGSLAIGFSVTAGALAGTFSGGSMNPARSLGPAVVTGIWEHHWVYWLGPTLGAVLGGVTYEFLFASSASREKLVACLTCRDIQMVEMASASRSSLSPPGVLLPKPPSKEEQH